MAAPTLPRLDTVKSLILILTVYVGLARSEGIVDLLSEEPRFAYSVAEQKVNLLLP
jgi:hypothetical protein